MGQGPRPGRPKLADARARARRGRRPRLDPPALRLPVRGRRRADRGARRGEARAPLRRRAAPARERRDAEGDEARHDGGAPAPADRAAARAGSRASRCARPSSSASRARPTPTSTRSATSFARRASIGSASSATRTRRARRRLRPPDKVRAARSPRPLPEAHRAPGARSWPSELAAQVGREADVLVDAVLGRDRAIGRFASQAPEIDGVTHLATKKKGEAGQIDARSGDGRAGRGGPRGARAIERALAGCERAGGLRAGCRACGAAVGVLASGDLLGGVRASDRSRRRGGVGVRYGAPQRGRCAAFAGSVGRSRRFGR